MHVALFVTVSQGLRFARQTVSVQNRGGGERETGYPDSSSRRAFATNSG